MKYNEEILNEMVLNETYFGKNKNLLRCEELIGKLKNHLNTSTTNINNSKELKELQTILAKEFGFERVIFNIIYDERMENAFTVPFYMEKNFDSSSLKLERDLDGIRFKNNKGKFLYTYMTSKLIRYYTPEACMSALLHEIGHNFFLIDEQIVDVKYKQVINILMEIAYYMVTNASDLQCLYNGFCALADISLFLKSPQEYTHTSLEKLLERPKKYPLDDTKKKSVITKLINTLQSIALLGLKTVSSGLTILLMPLIIKAQRKNLAYNSKAYQSYNAEKFSDNFAASFGYGVELQEMLKKFGKKDDYLDKIPVLRAMNYYCDMLTETVLFFGDEHPTNYKRSEMMRQKLEYELKNPNLHPEHRAEIQRDIEKLAKFNKEIPLFKRAINYLFRSLNIDKDKIGSQGIKDTSIFDFDKELIQKYTESTLHIGTEFESLFEDVKEYLEFERTNFINESDFSDNPEEPEGSHLMNEDNLGLAETPTEYKKVYIFLSFSGTLFCKVINKVTNLPYSHVSISFDKSLNKLYASSFGGGHSGFTIETLNDYLADDARYSLYSIKVPVDIYEKLQNKIEYLTQQKKPFKYNFLGLAGFLINKPIERQHSMFCSQFVTELFKEAGLNLFNKPAGLVHPYDFAKNKLFKFEYRGKVKNFNPSKIKD